jgi:gas vesicle protein
MRVEEDARNDETEMFRDTHDDRDGGGMARFLLGVGVGLGLALLFAPQSGEETRRWLLETAGDRYRRLRRKGRRVIFETQDLLDRGEQHVARVLRSGKNALNSVASKLE